MPTRNISLTSEQDAFIDEMVGSGDYQNASEAVRDALRLLRARREEDSLRLDALRAQLTVAAKALEDGDFIEIGADEVDGFLLRLRSPVATD